MKKILFLISILFSLAASSQVVPQGVPQLFGGNWVEFRGHAQVDSSLLMKAIDTNFRPTKAALVTKASDRTLYYWNLSKWLKVQFTGESVLIEMDPGVSAVIKQTTVADTTRWGKVFIDSVKKKVATDSVFYHVSGVAIFAFLDEKANVSAKIDSVKKKTGTDSIFFYASGAAVFAFKDSIGAGGETIVVANQGTGAGIFQQKIGSEVRLRSISSPNANLVVTQNFNNIDLAVKPFVDSTRRRVDSVFFYVNGIEKFAFKDSSAPAASGEVNTASNVGTGAGIYKTKTGVNLEFKSIISANGQLAVTNNTNDLTLTLSQQIILVTHANLNGVMTPSASVIYQLTDIGQEGYFRYNAGSVIADNGGTEIVSSNGYHFSRIFNGAIDVRWFGATADGVSTTTPGTDDAAAINAAISAASTAQKVIVPSQCYIASTVNLNSTTKIIDLEVQGTIYVATGINGFVIENLRHSLKCSGTILGRNSGGTDSASFAAYTGVGVYLRNADKCNVDINGIQNFRVGLQVAGESTTTPNGSQYNNITYQQIKFNYIQIRITTIGSTTGVPPADQGNWCNSNIFRGGQLGGGTTQAGGTYGIVMAPDVTSDQGKGTDANPFNLNYFFHTGFEGLRYGLWAEKADANVWIGGRFERSAVTYKIYLREDNTLGKDCYLDRISEFTALYEDDFLAGGLGNRTVLSAGLLTASGTKSGQISIPNGAGRFLNITGNESTSAATETVHDFLSLGGRGNILDERYLGRVVRLAKGVDANIPLELKDTTITGSAYTVPTNVDVVYVNNASGITTITLPAVTVYRRRIIYIKNLSAAFTVTIAGTLGTTATTSLATLQGTLYSDKGSATWEDLIQAPAGGGSALTVVAPGTGNANGLEIVTGTIKVHAATNTQVGSITLRPTFDSAATKVLNIQGAGFGANYIVGRQNGISFNDNATANPSSATLKNYNFGSGSATVNPYFTFGKTSVTSVGFGNDGTDMIIGTEKTTNGVIWRKAIGFATADLSTGTFTGTNLMKLWPSGNLLIQAGGTYTDQGVNLYTGSASFLNLGLRAGTTTSLPLQFTAGTNLTTPLAGGMEYDGTFYYLTPSTALRQIIATASNAITFTGKTWNANTIGILYGGSGATTANAALNNFLPPQSGQSGKSLQTDGVNASWVAGTGGTSQWTTVANGINYSGTPGRVGIGVASPTGMLHLPAGTTALNTAPLKFTAGINLTTQEAGAVEYDGTRVYITPSLPSVARQTFITDINIATLTNKIWNGNAIGTFYIDGASGATAGDVLTTNGTTNGASFTRNEGGFLVYSATTTSATGVTLATFALPQSRGMELEIIVLGHNTVSNLLYRDHSIKAYATNTLNSASKGSQSLGAWTSDFTPAVFTSTAGGTLTYTITVSSVATDTINWTAYIKLRQTQTSQ